MLIKKGIFSLVQQHYFVDFVSIEANPIFSVFQQYYCMFESDDIILQSKK